MRTLRIIMDYPDLALSGNAQSSNFNNARAKSKQNQMQSNKMRKSKRKMGPRTTKQSCIYS